MLADVGFLGDLVQPNSRLDGFPLGEKQGLGHVPFGIEKPELKQLAGNAGRLWIFRLPPSTDFPTKQIDDMRAVVRSRDFIQLHQLALRALTNRNTLNFRGKDAAALDGAGIVQLPGQIGGIMPVGIFVRII